jgi:hypothetical protein
MKRKTALRKKLAAAVCAVGVSALSASAALAGEVKGPPTGTPGQGGFTPIENDIAASGCAFNGLNDFIQGQTALIVQNYGANKRLGLDPAIYGFPGTGCNPAVTPPGLG